MRKMKILLIPFFCILFAINGFALTADDNVYEFEAEDIVVKFEEDNDLSASQKQRIADYLVYGGISDSGAQTYAWCWLTGHDLTTHVVSVIRHKHSTLSPRCLEELYLVDTCSKCDYIKEELQGGAYIYCCPED